MEFKTTPFEHQLEAFNRFKDAHYCALLADMGTGKSKVAIDLSCYKYLKGWHNRVLIIASTTVHPQWLSEQFPAHSSVYFEGFSYKSDKSVKFLRRLDDFLRSSKGSSKLLIFTMNTEAFARPAGLELAKQFCNTSNKPPILIIDEASRIKNPEAKSVKS